MASKVAPQFDVRIRLLMERVGGLRALAEQVGVSHPAVKLWLGGTIPHRKTLERICERCHVRREWLLDGVEPVNDNVGSEGGAKAPPYAAVAPEFYRLYDAFRASVEPLPAARQETAWKAFFEMIMKVFGNT